MGHLEYTLKIRRKLQNLQNTCQIERSASACRLSRHTRRDKFARTAFPVAGSSNRTSRRMKLSYVVRFNTRCPTYLNRLPPSAVGPSPPCVTIVAQGTFSKIDGDTIRSERLRTRYRPKADTG